MSNGYGGAVLWNGTQGTLEDCNFINNTANLGGGVYWWADNGTLIGSTFINNSANSDGGAIGWWGENGTINSSTFINNVVIKKDGGGVSWGSKSVNGIIMNSIFINNTARHGGGIWWGGVSGSLINSTFINNNATYGGAVCWNGANSTLTDSNFIKNTALNGGGIYWNGAKGILTNSNFTSNSANRGGGVYWYIINGTLTNSIFTSNAATYGGAVLWGGKNGILTGSTFKDNSASLDGGAVNWADTNGTLIDSIFTGNNANKRGGAVHWEGSNSTMSNSNFTNNHASNGDNVYWVWTADDFLKKYNQINDYDYVYIQNGVGTPLSTIRLDKKDITISSQGKVTFDAKGGNVHFEITGNNVLIEKLTFRNFNFTTYGGALLWRGSNGILKNCNFFNNTANILGGGIHWMGANGTMKDCTFRGNTAGTHGAGCDWSGIDGVIISSTFINNTVNQQGGGLYWTGANGTVSNSFFINNTAGDVGGGLFWTGANGTLTSSTFTGNTANFGGAINWSGTNGAISSSNFNGNSAKSLGGAINWGSVNGAISSSNFNDNTAGTHGGAIYSYYDGIVYNSIFTRNSAKSLGGAICWRITGSMINCSFVNSKWIDQKSNGIYSNDNLTINGGMGIVDIGSSGTLSGISIVVLNNETYYYPPNTNINFINKNDNDRNSILIIKIKSYYMKALVSDNSGTLLERYRAIKDIENDEIFTNINSLNLIDSGEYLNLVVLQFDTTVLLDFPRDMLISDIVHKYKIDFDVSFHSEDVSRTEIAEIIYNDSEATIGDIVDCFMVLKEKIPKIEICNGSALIVDIKEKRIKYTITSAGKLFPSVKPTIEKLQEENIKIFIASGDRKGAIQNLATLLNIPKENAYGTVTTEGKCKIVKKLQNKGFRVLMVGDGLNDILAFKTADISVLTVEQEEEISEKLLDKTDFIIKEFSEIIPIIERDL